MSMERSATFEIPRDNLTEEGRAMIQSVHFTITAKGEDPVMPIFPPDDWKLVKTSERRIPGKKKRYRRLNVDKDMGDGGPASQ